MGYKIEIRHAKGKGGEVVWQRLRDTMPEAIIAAEQGVVKMHEMLGFKDERALGIDIDCARGWNPRTAPISIVRGSLRFVAKGN